MTKTKKVVVKKMNIKFAQIKLPKWLRIYLWTNFILMLLLQYVGGGSFNRLLQSDHVGKVTLDVITEYHWGRYDNGRIEICFSGNINGRKSQIYFDLDMFEITKNREPFEIWTNERTGLGNIIISTTELYGNNYREGCPVKDVSNLRALYGSIGGTNYTFFLENIMQSDEVLDNYLVLSRHLEGGFDPSEKYLPGGGKTGFSVFIGTDPEVNDENRYFHFWIRGDHREDYDIKLWHYGFALARDFFTAPVRLFVIAKYLYERS